jgi:hypothetical protein
MSSLTSDLSIASSVAGAIGLTSISSALSSVDSVIQNVGNLNLPLPNQLSTYATYDYILGIGVLTNEQYSNPTDTYIAGQRIELICKSANADPTNRVRTQYGQFDFFINNLVLENTIGFKIQKNSFVTTLSFDIYEPYGLGMFVLALQQAAADAGWKNWREAPFLLSIEFRGNQQNGAPVNIPGTYRYIPFHITTMQITASEKGTTYNCEGYGCNGKAWTEEYAKSKSDVSIKGKTVQEVLQTGDKSLQAVLNARAAQFVADGTDSTPTQYIITFPESMQSSANSQPNDLSSALTATISPSTAINRSSLSSLLGFGTNQQTGQATTPCNIIGKASMGFGTDRKASAPINMDGELYDPKQGGFDMSKNTTDPAENNMTFASTQHIDQVINNVILQSSYPSQALGEGAVDENGMRVWWCIDTQTYFIKDDANLAKTGITPKVIVYRILPYKAHAGAVSSPNTQPPGYKNISANIIKEYNYIYTGQNTEVLNFNIDFSNSFANIMAADNLSRSQDVQMLQALGSGVFETFNWLSSIFSFIKPFFSGNLPSSTPGVLPSQTRYTGTSTSTVNKGGGGQENADNVGGRNFFDAVSNGYDMVDLKLTIQGDPYWIAHSGVGNYTATPTQYKDLNADGTVSYQGSEVDISVNFRCPIDVNQATGLYNFGVNSKVAPVIHFSGLYHVNQVTSSFKDGRFTQELHGYRRQQQENPTVGSLSSLFNISKIIS